MYALIGRFSVVCAVLVITASFARAGPEELPKPSKKDKCPVCGMFVYKYPDFLARVAFRDGSMLFFDGAKDMFKYLLSMKKFSPGKTPADIKSVHVTEYYRLVTIDALKAYYVVGSDVYGPMGRELIPFEKESEAKEFLSDHRGRAVLRYGNITLAVLGELDR
jgi:nitrous oxide reductase accessory protein NosL